MDDVKNYIKYAYLISGAWTDILMLYGQPEKKTKEDVYKKLLFFVESLQLIDEMQGKAIVDRSVQEEIEKTNNFEKAKEKIGSILLASAFNNLARSYLLSNQSDKSRKYFHKALEVCKGQAPSSSFLNMHEEFQTRQLEEKGVKVEKNKNLKQLYKDHNGLVSDKWLSYLNIYDVLFLGYRNKPLSLLEIGVQNGGSLEIWGKFFPNAVNIIGCDIDQKCAQLNFSDSRISVLIGDINSDEVKEKITKHTSSIDIIIDDGSHISSDIIKTFLLYFPYLSDGGVYIAEDLHCSYWQGWEGGLFAPHSSIAFFKKLIDIINYEHWGIKKTKQEILGKYEEIISDETLQSIHSISFFNSLCIIRKEKPYKNSLQNRFIAGSIAKTDERPLKLHGSIAIKKNEENNIWSKFEK